MELRHLATSDLRLGLIDLCDKRKDLLLQSRTGQTYAPILAGRRDAIAALTLGAHGKAHSSDLATADATHHAYGLAIFHLCEAYAALTDESKELAAIAVEVRQAFVPKLEVLNASYATEADAAIAQRAKQSAMRVDLDRFPVAPATTLNTWIERFLVAGETLDSLLSARADFGNPENPAKLRTSTIGILSRFRASLADEIEHDSQLPRDLETQLFGYFDELATTRKTEAQARIRRRAEAVTVRQGGGSRPPPVPTPSAAEDGASAKPGAEFPSTSH